MLDKIPGKNRNQNITENNKKLILNKFVNKEEKKQI